MTPLVLTVPGVPETLFPELNVSPTLIYLILRSSHGGGLTRPEITKEDMEAKGGEELAQAELGSEHRSS